MRAVRLMNAFGDAAEHVVLNATDQWGARDAIAPDVKVSFPADAPSLIGRPGPLRYRRIASYLRGFDLVLTYNWGAMDVVAARRLFANVSRLPPLIHHEDGFNADEAVRQKPLRIHFRRLMLAGADRLVVPSQRLERIAIDTWRRPPGQVVRIPNGIPLARYGRPPEPGAIPGFQRQPGEIVIGTVAGLRAVKNLPRLVRLFARGLGERGRLVIVGEGPERAAIETIARELGVAERVHLPGFLPDPARYLGHFDAFALTSDSEQFPISLVEAMAAGLFCIATDVGDVAAMLPPGNVIADPADEQCLLAGFALLTDSPEQVAKVGAANQAHARTNFAESDMISRYASLYGEAIGRPGAFGTLPQ